MKKILILTTVLCTLICVDLSAQHKVLMIPREGSYSDLDRSIQNEIVVMLSFLYDAGYTVDIASQSGKPFIGSNISVNTKRKISDVNVKEYDGIILPCMSVGMPGPISKEAVDLVKEGNILGLPIAAQDGSVYIIQAAGLLVGKKYSFYCSAFTEGIYNGQGATIDNNIITSSGDPGSERKGYADQTCNIMKLFIEELKKRKK